MFRDGFCKNCFFLKFFNICIYKPYLCTSHLNIEKKNLKKEKEFEIQDHIVYISFTNNIKIGITLKKLFLKRLMDQGAIIAIKLAKTPNRYISGIIENLCKYKISDKTNFRKMLTINLNKKKLIFIRKKILNIKNNLINNNLKKFKKYIIMDNKFYYFKYPIYNFNKKKKKKINIIKLDKYKFLYKKLKGIKGQYLIFKNNYFLNIRSHIGYIIDIKILK